MQATERLGNFNSAVTTTTSKVFAHYILRHSNFTQSAVKPQRLEAQSPTVGKDTVKKERDNGELKTSKEMVRE
jgi:hypothetical protein